MAGNTKHGYIDVLAYEGQILTNRMTEKISGRTVTGELYPYGRAVKWNDSNKEIVPLDSETDVIIGVLIRAMLHEDYLDSNGDYGYPPNENVIFLRRGDIAVYTETNIAHNDPVFVRHTANGAGKDKIGVFRNDDDGASDTCIQLTNASWLPLWDTVDGTIAKAGG
jgi:hypothetical protein